MDLSRPVRRRTQDIPRRSIQAQARDRRPEKIIDLKAQTAVIQRGSPVELVTVDHITPAPEPVSKPEVTSTLPPPKILPLKNSTTRLSWSAVHSNTAGRKNPRWISWCNGLATLNFFENPAPTPRKNLFPNTFPERCILILMMHWSREQRKIPLHPD